jgi:hypothetical protein
MPTQAELAEMGAFNKVYLDSGVILHADGFLASKSGARVHYSKDAAPKVESGPFGLDNLVAGYWVLKLNTLEEAIEFAKKAPFKDGAVEVRQIAGIDDFGDALPADMKKQMEENADGA